MRLAESEVETLLTAKEVAQRWGMCTKTIRRMADRGDLRPIRFSARCMRFSAGEVAAAVARVSGSVSAGGTL